MERSVALKKLKKLLGESFSYRVDIKAPNADGRAEACEKKKVVEKLYYSLGQQLSARRAELLEADPEHQRLLAEYTATQEERAELSFVGMSYRFTVFASIGPFNCVEAVGDSWEEIIDEVTKKRAA